jgi:hypothetical protein
VKKISILNQRPHLAILKKWMFALLALLFAANNGWGQVSTYGFSQSARTYTAITGGTQIANQTALTGAGAIDDAVYSSGTIPFTFTFNGTGYTSCNISSNGFITFGATAPGNAVYTPISDNTTYSGAISALGIDLLGGFGYFCFFSARISKLAKFRCNWLCWYTNYFRSNF